MFGTVLYQQENYQELLLAEENGVRCIVCLQGRSTKLFRIEWPFEDDPTYTLNSAQYHILDAIKAFQEALAVVKEEQNKRWEDEDPFSQPCYVCNKPVDYQRLGNGEEWAVPKCAYCERVVCPEHSFTNTEGWVCCSDPVCKGEIPSEPFQSIEYLSATRCSHIDNASTRMSQESCTNLATRACAQCASPLCFAHAFSFNGLEYCARCLPEYHEDEQW